MENQLQPARKKTRLLGLVSLILAGFVILGVALFYFLPLPQTVKNQTKQAVFERCFYAGGIGYSAVFSAGDIKQKSFFSSNGDKLCSVGGVTGSTVEEGPCKQSLCFSVNSK